MGFLLEFIQEVPPRILIPIPHEYNLDSFRANHRNYLIYFIRNSSKVCLNFFKNILNPPAFSQDFFILSVSLGHPPFGSLQFKTTSKIHPKKFPKIPQGIFNRPSGFL